MKTASNLAAVLVALTCISTPAFAKIYKWVDENGITHFGEQIPAQYLEKSEDVKLQEGPSDEDVREAERVAAETRSAVGIYSSKPKRRVNRSKTPGITKSSPPPFRPKAGSVNGSGKTKEQRYEESQRCFAMYRNENGGLAKEAYRNCQVVKK